MVTLAKTYLPMFYEKSLVSTVANDTNEVLSRVDEKLKIDLKDDNIDGSQSDSGENMEDNDLIVDEEGNIVESGIGIKAILFSFEHFKV